jgi:hypothetical protein
MRSANQSDFPLGLISEDVTISRAALLNQTISRVFFVTAGC